MTFQEFDYYSKITNDLFNYMNGRINQLNNKCQLIIDAYDFITHTYGNIKYPNLILIHIGTIVDTWQDRWSIYLSKQEYIATCIAWAISHELHHADQLISMVMYGSNEAYKNEMEADVERASYDWICNHSRELSELIGIRMCMDKLESNTLVDKGNYKKANVREFYLQTIANIVIRDLNLFDQLKVFNNDNMCDDMILVFNDIDTIVIKSNGKFLEENIVPFCNLVYKYCSVYNMYHISVDASFSYNSTGRCMVTVQFNVSKPLIHPMKFKSDSPISV